MKLITISNGETRIGYELNDLTGYANDQSMNVAKSTLKLFEDDI